MAGDADDRSIDKNATKHIRRGITLLSLRKITVLVSACLCAAREHIKPAPNPAQTTIEREAQELRLHSQTRLLTRLRRANGKQGVSALREVRKEHRNFSERVVPSYWYARIWIPSQKKYLIQSTKRGNRVLTALASARDLCRRLTKNQMRCVKVPRSRSFWQITASMKAY